MNFKQWLLKELAGTSVVMGTPGKCPKGVNCWGAIGSTGDSVEGPVKPKKKKK